MAPAEPYDSAEVLGADVQVVIDSLRSHHGQALASNRIDALARAIGVFGFHLASVDMRQVSDVHEAVIAELFAAAGIAPNYAAPPEQRKLELLLAELRQPRLLTLPWHQYSEQTRKELAIFAAARDLRGRYGKRIARNYIISHTETLSDLVEVMLLQKESGMLQDTPGSKDDPARMAASRQEHTAADRLLRRGRPSRPPYGVSDAAQNVRMWCVNVSIKKRAGPYY